MVVSKNLSWNEAKVSPEERKALMRQEVAAIGRLTGLSGSGKSTIAYELEKRLILRGHAAYTLDGGNVRHGLVRDLGFAPHDRTENIRRIAEVCKPFNKAGMFVVTSFIFPYIFPYRADRAMAHEIIGTGRFLNVYLETSINECERRDPRGLYKKARAGEISDFTGITAPYEVSDRPELKVDGSRLTVPESAETMLRLVEPRFSRG